MRTTLLSALALLALSSAACGSAPPTEGSDASSHPSWLLGHWSWSEQSDEYGDAQHHTLGADGTAEHRTWHARKSLVFGVIDGSVEDVTTWSATATTLDFGGQQLPLHASPNCRLLQLGGRVFAHDDREHPGCPFAVAPLTDLELSLVGSWKFWGPTSDAWAFSTLHIGDDRDVRMTLNPHAPKGDPNLNSVRAYYDVDPDGLLHGWHPAGEEVLTLELQLYNEGTMLKVCAGRCVSMKRE